MIGPTMISMPGKYQSPVRRTDRRLTAGTLVQIPDLVAHRVRQHEADEDGEDQRDRATKTVAGVLLHLLVRLEEVVPAVDPEGHQEQQDRDAGRPHLADRAVPAVRLHLPVALGLRVSLRRLAIPRGLVVGLLPVARLLAISLSRLLGGGGLFGSRLLPGRRRLPTFGRLLLVVLVAHGIPSRIRADATAPALTAILSRHRVGRRRPDHAPKGRAVSWEGVPARDRR